MILDKGGWFPINCEVIRDTSPTAAILFFFLINMDDRHADSEGWFYAKNNYLSEQLGLKKDALKNAFDLLHLRGYLGVKAITGYPNGYKILRYESTETVGVAEKPHTLSEKQNNPAVLPHTPASNPPPLPCGKTSYPLRENLLPPAVLTLPACGFSAYPPAGNPHTNKEYIKEELSNNNKKQKVKEEDSADFTNPLSPPDFSEEVGQISFLAAKLVKPENLSERVWGFFAALCKSKKKKFTKKGWGAATNKLVEGFNEFGETAIFEHLERWANSTTWTTPFFPAWREAIQKANPTAIIENDPRNTAENVSITKKAFMRIKELYSKLGEGLVPSGGNDFEREKVVLKELWAELLAVTPAQPAEFEKELAIIETALKAEKAQRSNGKVTTQPKGFIGWIKSKGWLLFVKPTKAVQVQAPTKPQQTQKTAPIAPKTPTVEQTPETPTNVQHDEDLRLYNVTPDYKVLGDAAERAKAFMGKVFVWDSNETQYSNQETFRKLTGINRRALLAQNIFDTRAFAEYITKQFGVDYECADKLSKALCYMIPEPHEVIVTQQERAGFPVTDVSKFLTTRSINS